MTDVNSTYTSLKDAINICLSCIGETPVDAPNNTSTNVVLSKQIIEEVSRDVQSKGWWFNTSGANISLYANSGSGASENFNASIPEEARRYIAIRAARVFQSRFVGSEELQKFSFQEEQVSLAILTQAHVRNGGNATSFTAFPTELKALGIEEVMFLQQSAEEKLLSLRLKTELKQAEKLAAEKELTEAQRSAVQTETVLKSQQALTELENTNLVAQNAIKTAAEAGLVTSQQALIAQQVLDVVADITLKTKQGEKIDEEVDLLQTQDLLTSAQKDTELQNAIKVSAEAGLVTAQQALVAQQVLDSVADVALKGKQGLLLDEQIATEQKETDKREAEKELVDEQKGLVSKQSLTEVQNAIKVAAESGLISSQQALVSQQTLDAAADITLKGKQGALIDAQVATEGKRPADIEADTTLKGAQSGLITSQTSTETQNAIKVAAEAGLVTAQQALVAQQVLESAANVSNIEADVTLKGKQGSLVDAQAADVAADTTLKGKQGALIEAQELKTDAEKSLIASQTTTDGIQRGLIVAQTVDVAADTTLKGKQGALVDAQELKTDAETALTSNQSDLIASQKTELDAKTAIEATAEKDFYDGVVAGTQATYRDFAAEMRMMGIQESMFQSTPAYKKVELLKDAEKLRTVTATEFGNLTELKAVNKVMRLIGEPPVLGPAENSLASECMRLLRDTDTDLQGRGWYFNTDDDGVITKKPLDETPQKYREYLNVRVAILLTELYPQSGIDIQRLPKMEQELRAYFKDRDFDDASYSVFDNYDAATRIGINRNFSIL